MQSRDLLFVDQVFKIVASVSELLSGSASEKGENGIVIKEAGEIMLEVLPLVGTMGKLELIGSQDKLNSAAYTEADVVKVHNEKIKFGTGLAALGEDYSDYKGMFGESMIIDGNFYSFPALKKSAVDFILSSEVNSSLTYKYFHGFGYKGAFASLVKFSGKEEFVKLADVIKQLEEFSKTNKFGVVLIAESGGIKGMHLKQIPIAENKPENGGIFDQQNFGNWLDFPLESSNNDNIIAACGIAVKDKLKLPADVAALFSSDAGFHIHAGIFEKGSINKNITEFNAELKRILSELQVYKIQHLLGDSKFKCGIAAIIELED